jgi:hypothetical protein
MAANQCGELYRSHSGNDDLNVQRVTILRDGARIAMYIGSPAYLKRGRNVTLKIGPTYIVFHFADGL